MPPAASVPGVHTAMAAIAITASATATTPHTSHRERAGCGTDAGAGCDVGFDVAGTSIGAWTCSRPNSTVRQRADCSLKTYVCGGFHRDFTNHAVDYTPALYR